jgi:enamine deaminase RidA (YjgF/YER057c/UK114 family)
MRNGLNRINICTKSPWESGIGYSLVVHLNPFVYVSGTTATDEKGIIVGLDDP